MATETKTIRVGSRKSQLALIQTNHVIALLKEKMPNLNFEIITMTTKGDQILDIALSKIGEKALFTKELEDALLDRRVDFVVHSLKDLPSVLPDGMVIGSILKRDDPRDAVIMHPKNEGLHISDLPADSVIGTSSLRRASQLKRAYGHLRFEDIRGNLNTRLRKLDGADTYSALILAAAGMERMQWNKRISHVLEPSECMYAVCQGALAVECRDGDNDTLRLLSELSDYKTVLGCVAERAFLKTLEGGCSVPVAVHTDLSGVKLMMHGGIFSIDGSEACKDIMWCQLPENNTEVEHEVSAEERRFASIAAQGHPEKALLKAEQLGTALAHRLLQSEGRRILCEAKATMAASIMKMKEEQLMKSKRDQDDAESNQPTKKHKPEPEPSSTEPEPSSTEPEPSSTEPGLSTTSS